MKTFIFTVFLLAGHSVWAQGSESGSEDNILGLQCLGKIVQAAPTFATDLVDFLCLVYNSDMSSEDKAEKIVTFVEKYGDVVEGCDLRKILGIGKVNAVDVLADISKPNVKNVIAALDTLGLRDVISLVCGQATCITKIVASVRDLLKKVKLTNPTEVCKTLDKTIYDWITENCLLPKTAVPGAVELVKELAVKLVLKQVGDLLNTVCKGVGVAGNLLGGVGNLGLGGGVNLGLGVV